MFLRMNKITLSESPSSIVQMNVQSHRNRFMIEIDQIRIVPSVFSPQLLCGSNRQVYSILAHL